MQGDPGGSSGRRGTWAGREALRPAACRRAQGAHERRVGQGQTGRPINLGQTFDTWITSKKADDMPRPLKSKTLTHLSAAREGSTYQLHIEDEAGKKALFELTAR